METEMELARIVVGMDFNEPSLAASRWLARHFAPDAELVLVHTLELIPPPDFLEDLLPSHEAVVEAMLEDANRTLDDLADALETERVTKKVRVGRPALEIAAEAGEEGADLIVVGEHGLRPQIRGILGSTADQLVRCAPVPVLLARRLPEAEPRSILVPVDESPRTAAVLRWARLLGERFDAKITALYTLSLGLYGSLRLIASQEGARRLQERTRDAAARWLEEQLRAAGIPAGAATAEIAFGDPGFEAAAAADRFRADLVIVSSGGAEALGPASLGGTVSAVIRGTNHPILAIVDGACD